MTQGASNVLEVDSILDPDQLACQISDNWMQWDMYRQPKVAEWEEVQRYIFATNTKQTSNSKLPWSNTTTLPKLTQIRDNLGANYLATLLPKRKWLTWEGATQDDETAAKKKAIESYMTWALDRSSFYEELSKATFDYIDYGNCFLTIDWQDERQPTGGPDGEESSGYVGPIIRRISPLDIVFNPTASDFKSSPKIVRSLVSLGEVKEMLERYATTDEERQENEALWKYMKDIRSQVGLYPGNTITKDAIYSIAGFDTFSAYLSSNYVEILTFYGDIFSQDEDKFLRNHVIMVVDRHKIIKKAPNESYFGSAPIYHSGWRIRQDNLWAQGPLDNLIGMQYRIDHLENMKADVFDLIAYPPIMIKGYVEDFDWGPFERIYVGDQDGDVELLSPDVQALNADTQIAILEQKMEEFAGSPKEAMGFRTPGEKTKYEVQRLENAAARIFEAKIGQFERQIVEPATNGMLELARRRMDVTTIRVLDDQYNQAAFRALTREDITGAGRIRPVAARHFAEQAQLVQDLTSFFGSVPGSDPSILAHFSSVKLAKLFENVLNLEDWEIVQPYVRIAEQAEAQQLASISQEQTATETTTPGGIMPGDYDANVAAENPDQSGAPPNVPLGQ